MKTNLRGKIREFVQSEEGKVGVKSPLTLGAAVGSVLLAQAIWEQYPPTHAKDAKVPMTARMVRYVLVLSLMERGHVFNTVNIGCGVDCHNLIDFSACGSFYCHTLLYAESIKSLEQLSEKYR